MNNIKVSKDKEYVIGVVAPRERGTAYSVILPGVIRAIDRVESSVNDPSVEPKKRFLFLHDGVTSGALGHVIEVVNKIQGSMLTRGRVIGKRKIPLDVERYGRNSQHRWVDQVIQFNPDLLLILDDGAYSVARYAKQQAEQAEIETQIVVIPKTEDKQRVID